MSREANELDWTALGDDETVITDAAGTKVEPWYQSILRSTLPVLASTYQQQQLNKLNLERMRQGLSPISGQQYANQYMVPAAQVQVGMTGDTQKLVMYGGLALLAFLGINSMMKHRR
jgi:hypothetical protein